MSKDLNKKDLFTDKVTEKLAGYELTPEPAVWEAVQAGLNASRRKKRIAPVWWITTGMAAAVALLLVLNLTLQHDSMSVGDLSHTTRVAPKLPETVSEKPASKTLATVPQTTPSEEPEQITGRALKHSVVQPLPTDENQSRQVHETISGQAESKTENLNADIHPSVNEQAVPKNTENQIADNQHPNVESKKSDQNNALLPAAKNEWEDPLKKKQAGEWEMLAMVGTSQNRGTTGGSLNGYSSLRDGMFQASSSLVNLTDLFPEFDDKTYFAPVSVGVSVSGMLTKNIFVESGLKYTYLHSQFKNSLSVANLHLHYIGIPLSVGYRIKSGKNWYFYTSGGIVAEKGLSSVYDQTIRYSNNTIKTSTTESINGMQWSVNASVGVGYNLSRKFSLCFEPEFGYYFDNNQPVSARTENQLTLGVKAGLRFHL